MEKKSPRRTPFWLCLIAVAMAAAGAGHGQRLTLPRVHKESLLNGMRFLTFEGAPARVPFQLMIENGAAFDPVEKWGVTHLMLSMMMQQTESLDATQIAQELSRLDATLEARASWDAIFFSGTVPRQFVEDLLTLLAEIVVRPEFDQEGFDRARDELLKRTRDESASLAGQSAQLLRSQVFGANPYGHSVLGTPETVANLYLEDVILQYRRLFVPNQAQLALYHDDGKSLAGRMGRRWGSWVRGEAMPFTFRRATPPGSIQISLLEAPAARSMLRWGQLGVPRGNPDYLALEIFEQYVTLALPDWGQEIAGNRQVRAGAELSGGKMPGLFQFSVQAPPQHLLAYHERFRALLDRTCAGDIDAGRFEEARELVFQQLASRLADPITRLALFQEAELRDLGINYLATFKLRLDRVRPEFFQQVLKRELNTRPPVLVVAGPSALLKADLESLGPVRLLN